MNLAIAKKCRVELLDHLVGATEQRQGNSKAQRFGSFEIYEQFDFRGLLHRQVSWLLAMENFSRIEAD